MSLTMSSQNEDQSRSSTTLVGAALSTPVVPTDAAEDAKLLVEDVPMEDAEAPPLRPSTDAVPPNTNALSIAPVPGEDVIHYLDSLPPLSEKTRLSFQPHFAGPDSWQRAFDFRRRDDRLPSIQPIDDPTISQVVLYRDFWVSDMCKAIVNLEGALDDEVTIKREYSKPCVYDTKEVEAVCRCIFVPSCQTPHRGCAC
jgi:hypothetical protein